MKPAKVIELHNKECPWPFCGKAIDRATAKTKKGWSFCGKHSPGFKPLTYGAFCCQCREWIPEGEEALVLPDPDSLNEYGGYDEWFVLHPRGECKVATAEGAKQMPTKNMENEETRARTPELVNPKGFVHMEAESRRVVECIIPLIDQYGLVGGGSGVFKEYLPMLQEAANTNKSAIALYNLWCKYRRNLKEATGRVGPLATSTGGGPKTRGRWSPDQEDLLLRYVSVALTGTGKTPNQSWFHRHVDAINEMTGRNANASSLAQKWNRLTEVRPDDVDAALGGSAWESSPGQNPAPKEPPSGTTPEPAPEPKPKPTPAKKKMKVSQPVGRVLMAMARRLEKEYPFLPYMVDGLIYQEASNKIAYTILKVLGADAEGEQ